MSFPAGEGLNSELRVHSPVSVTVGLRQSLLYNTSSVWIIV